MTDAASADGAVPRTPRRSVMLSAHVFRQGATAPSVHRITNISETGICLAQDGEMRPDTVVVVSVGQAEPAAAEVKWVRDRLAGLAFHDPIDLAKARLRRTDGRLPAVASGWLTDLNDAHRGR